ncbi:30S ribosomal protein S18 [Candidatus Tremblaya phenacola]|uniref:30S ribosomal protein S18 n=1 Tax=Candidatus Tremblayella phenacoccinincola TaxID=1010676 RepID=UPI00133018EB|nr:30S ribosomal protein S18 [Candidatus Tremblaya phenacola]KAH0998354.1 SSU ribosomal protein S18p [Candidatus Tremblaya phenacola]
MKKQPKPTTNVKNGVTLKKKACYFTCSKFKHIDYKDIKTLRAFVTSFGKITPSRLTGTETRFQRQLSTAIKRARFLSLLPYTSLHLINKEPNRNQ